MTAIPEQFDQHDLQRFLEVAPDALLVIDAHGRILRLNQQVEQLFGYARAELVGAQVELLLPERFRARHRAHRTAYHARPRLRAMGEGLELFGRRRDGSEFPVDISLGPVEIAGGTVVVAAVRDASERRRAEHVARQHAANQLRRRQALELNDGVVQGLAAASMALEVEDVARARELLAGTLVAARALVSQLLDDLDTHPGVAAGDLVRSEPAILRRDPS